MFVHVHMPKEGHSAISCIITTSAGPGVHSKQVQLRLHRQTYRGVCPLERLPFRHNKQNYPMFGYIKPHIFVHLPSPPTHTRTHVHSAYVNARKKNTSKTPVNTGLLHTQHNRHKHTLRIHTHTHTYVHKHMYDI